MKDKTEKRIKEFFKNHKCDMFRVLLILVSISAVLTESKLSFVSSIYSTILNNFVLTFILLVFVSLLSLLYWNWIKHLWKFLQKNEILKYIAFIIVPIAIIVISYQYWFHIPTLSLNINTGSSEIIIDRLNGFYASLFTAIAVIIGIAGLKLWNSLKDTDEKLKELKKTEEKVNDELKAIKEIKEKVDFLHKIKDHADWVRRKFDNEADDSVSSDDINMSDDDKDKLKQIEKRLIDDFTNNSWLEIMLAKEMLKKREYLKADRLYSFIENRDLLDDSENSKIEAVLYHLRAQLYWNYYLKVKGDDKKSDNVLDQLLRNCKLLKGNTNNENNDKKYLLLEIAKEYYEKSLELREKKNIDLNETLGNLSVVLIEMARLDQNERKKFLEDARNNLYKIIELKKATFNTYYDLARFFWLNTKDIDKVRDNLNIAVDYINSIKAKDRFLSLIKEEEELRNIKKEWESIKKDLKNKLDRKKWLK